MTDRRVVLVLLVAWPGAASAADTRALNGKAWEAFRARDFAVAEVSRARAAPGPPAAGIGPWSYGNRSRESSIVGALGFTPT